MVSWAITERAKVFYYIFNRFLSSGFNIIFLSYKGEWLLMWLIFQGVTKREYWTLVKYWVLNWDQSNQSKNSSIISQRLSYTSIHLDFRNHWATLFQVFCHWDILALYASRLPGQCSSFKLLQPKSTLERQLHRFMMGWSLGSWKIATCACIVCEMSGRTSHFLFGVNLSRNQAGAWTFP